ncbi:MAG: hypothetical protein ACOYK8_07120 [Alphaproteobacteria bacterium]
MTAAIQNYTKETDFIQTPATLAAEYLDRLQDFSKIPALIVEDRQQQTIAINPKNTLELLKGKYAIIKAPKKGEASVNIGMDLGDLNQGYGTDFGSLVLLLRDTATNDTLIWNVAKENKLNNQTLNQMAEALCGETGSSGNLAVSVISHPCNEYLSHLESLHTALSNTTSFPSLSVHMVNERALPEPNTLVLELSNSPAIGISRAIEPTRFSFDPKGDMSYSTYQPQEEAILRVDTRKEPLFTVGFDNYGYDNDTKPLLHPYRKETSYAFNQAAKADITPRIVEIAPEKPLPISLMPGPMIVRTLRPKI